jgi:hypothetical protein
MVIIGKFMGIEILELNDNHVSRLEKILALKVHTAFERLDLAILTFKTKMWIFRVKLICIHSGRLSLFVRLLQMGQL